MAEVALRSVIGFLVQVFPCAALCVVPFTHRLDLPLRRLVTILGIAIAAALVPFTYFAAGPLPGPLEPWRLTVQNIVFTVLVCALVAILFPMSTPPLRKRRSWSSWWEALRTSSRRRRP